MSDGTGSVAMVLDVVHTGTLMNRPQDIELCLKYSAEVQKAFFKIGAKIAVTECTCPENRYSVVPCPRCKLVEFFGVLRRHLAAVKENMNHG